MNVHDALELVSRARDLWKAACEAFMLALLLLGAKWWLWPDAPPPDLVRVAGIALFVIALGAVVRQAYRYTRWRRLADVVEDA